MESVKKSNFSGLVIYITNEQNKNERVGEVTVTNCHSDQAEAAMIEVLNTQAQNTRAASDKTYHLLISFRPDEQPDATTLKAIEMQICESLGLGDHQRISAVHHDTDNLHLHIAINKIHHTTHTIKDPYNAYFTIGQVCERLERDFGLEPTNHIGLKCGAENRADDMENHTDIESLIGWIKRGCYDQLQEASSWKEMHQVLQENGLKLHERGNGFAITAEDGTTIKASSIGREFSRSKLESKLGAFQQPSEEQEPIRKYQKKPMRSRIDTAKLFDRYKKEQKEYSTVQKVALAKVAERKKKKIESVKKSSQNKRAAMKHIGIRGVEQKILSATISSTLKTDINVINKKYQKERQKIYDTYKRQTWADWLRTKATGGDQEALEALRAREVARKLKGNTVAGEAEPRPLNFKPNQDSITKKGTIIYCVGDTVLRDAGDKLKVSRGADDEGMGVALRMAMERYGNSIHVNGSAAYKEKMAQAAATAKLPITFDDAALESRRQELLQQTIAKESKHGHRNPGQSNTSRASGPTRIIDKPNVGRIGERPPPESQNRLRRLSELGVVHIASGSEVLLPGHVPDHLEQQGTQSVDRLRRFVSEPFRMTGTVDAAGKYIAEREEKRLKGIDIPRHSIFDHDKDTDGPASFAGIRWVDGKALALLRCGEEMKVLPVDDTAAERLQRLTIGTAVKVTGQGTIKKLGMRR